MSRVVIFFVLACLVFGACVPNKKLVYLQSEGELEKDFPKDTVLRSYELGNYEYRIQPEDILSIRIESLTEEEYDIFSYQKQSVGVGQSNQLLGGYLVGEDGEVEFPEIGQVIVGGLTLHEVEKKVTDIVSRYLSNPTVKVRLLNFRVSITGEVNSEGVFNSLNNRVTILEAIANAGGMSELADRSQVKVIRQWGDEAKVLYINLLEESVLKNDGFFLHPNDIVIVPPLRQRPFRRYFGPNLSLLVSTVSVVLLTINLLGN